MKTHRIIALLALSLSLTSQLHAQGGSLTPPAGAPAPVMHTLTEIFDTAQQASTTATAINDLVTAQGTQITNIEANMGSGGSQPGTPINTLPGNSTATHVISIPGRYYLTADIYGQSMKSGIRIDSYNVVIDLNGHTLWGVQGCTKGIEIFTAGPIIIRNGFITGWPQQAVWSATPTSLTVEDVSIQGITHRGIDVIGGAVIERVTIKNAVEYGIHCPASPQAIIRGCRVEDITSEGGASGIYAPNSLISSCAVSNVSGTGSEGASVSGISSLNGRVVSCIVRNVTQSGTASATGIELADSVQDCRVFQVFGNSSGSAGHDAAGIRQCENVIGCTVKHVNGLSNHSSKGIWYCRKVSHCRVSEIIGARDPMGIYGDDVSESNVEGVPYGEGIYTSRALHNTVKNCLGGISIGGTLGSSAVGNTIDGCGATGITISGIRASVMDNTVIGNGQPDSQGITVPNYPVKIEHNYVGAWATGINAAGASTLVIRNTAATNSVNYNVHASMPVVTPATLGTNPNANISQ